MKKKILLLILAIVSVSLSAKTYYVMATGGSDSNDGSTWNLAFASLQPALTVAVSGDNIWVAKGTYIPTMIAGDVPGLDPRDKAFSIKSGISVYGGFAGTETTGYDLTLRNFVTNQTILSGSLDGVTANNAYHVVVIVATTAATTLDGFSVTSGNANGTSTCTIGTRGIFRSQGGGINALSYGANVNLTNNTVYGNLSTNWGGGVFALTGTTAGIMSIIKNNINNNSCGTSNGGGMYVQTGLVNGLAYVANNVIYSNSTSTTNSGSGAYLSSLGIISFVNNTVSNNTSAAGTAPLYCYTPTNTTSTINVSNSIVYGNTPNTIGTNSQNKGTTTVSYCLIGGGYATGTGAVISNIININPLFVNSTGFDFRLSNTSPAINAGSNGLYNLGLYGSVDLSGIARINQTTIDLGSYEGSTVATGVNPAPASSFVFTNPITNNFSISGLAGNESITFYDVNGRQILSRHAIGGEITISTVSLKEGVYFVRVSSASNVVNLKLIKK